MKQKDEKKKEFFKEELKKVFTEEAEGFSYVETLVCIMVMLLLTVIVGVASLKLIDRAKEAKCHKEIEAFTLALEEYYSDCGLLPSGEQGLEALWKKPVLYPVPSQWKGPYPITDIRVFGRFYQLGRCGKSGVSAQP